VPSGSIDGFRLPPFLLPIYHAAGIRYGVRWEILAAVNEIETDYGRNVNVSSAGALGWMQFMPATWRSHGTDANRDGMRDPYNAIDAIFAAARYLKAAGAARDLRRALFAYNHSDAYVDAVLQRAEVLAGMPPGLVGSLTWLAQGRFPLAAAYPADTSPIAGPRPGVRITSAPRAAVVAVNDVRIVGIGRSRRLGRFVRARDAQGNTYVYAGLGSLAEHHPVPRPEGMTRSTARQLRRERLHAPATHRGDDRQAARFARITGAGLMVRLPRRPRTTAGIERYAASAEDARRLGLDPRDVVPRRLRRGSRVLAGAILGRLGERRDGRAPSMRFRIHPPAHGARPVDPRPILQSWRLLARAAGGSAAWRRPLGGADGRSASIGQIMLMPRAALTRRVLRDRRVELYDCGRRDVRGGRIDRRVLATLEYLAASGLRPTVTSLRCGHSRLTASGRVSYHSSGNAVDIAELNGVPVMGHQGSGSITDQAVRRVLALQGAMRPDEVISLMAYPGAPNAHAMADHADHIHVGFRPLGPGGADSLGPREWARFATRLGEIGNPVVRAGPSRAAVRVATPRRRSAP
jgi:hypothetical protein